MTINKQNIESVATAHERNCFIPVSYIALDGSYWIFETKHWSGVTYSGSAKRAISMIENDSCELWIYKWHGTDIKILDSLLISKKGASFPDSIDDFKSAPLVIQNEYKQFIKNRNNETIQKVGA